MSTVDDLKQILSQGDLEMDDTKRSSFLRHMNVDPRWDLSDKNFAAISAALTMLAERIDALETDAR